MTDETHESVTSSGEAAPKIVLKDVTLREGAQASPVSFTGDEKVAIAEALVDVGVGVLQVGFAGGDDAHLARVRAVCGSARLEVLAPVWLSTIVGSLESSFAAGADMCGIVAEKAGFASVGLSPEEGVELLGEVVSEAVRIGYPEIRVTLSYGSEADVSFRNAVYGRAVTSGAKYLGYADTPGTATPAKVSEAVGEIVRDFPKAVINSHMHNDFGLAVANTLAAADAGALMLDVTVNGLGDRAGNCPLDELAMALELLYGRDTGIDLSKLCDLSALVARFSGQEIPRMKPISGEDCFSHTLDLKVAAVVSGGVFYEPFDPALIGRTRTIKLGYGSGPAAIKATAARLDLEVSDDMVGDLVLAVNDLAVAVKRCVTDDEFRDLVKAHLSTIVPVA